MIVNNCVTDNAKLPLSAAQGKALMDLYTKLNSDLGNKIGLVQIRSVSFELFQNRFVVCGYRDTDKQSGIRFDINLINKSLTALEIKNGKPDDASGFTINAN